MKPQPKAAAKAVKAAPKAKAKTAAKTVKPAPKKAVASKAPAKKVVASKTTPAKAAKAVTATTTRPASKPAAKPAAKAAPKPVSKAPATKAAAPAPKKTIPAKAPAPVPAKAIARPTPVAASAMPPRAPDPMGSPARATRPSARLAQITVPSMAQSVASTAAKASYTQTPASLVLTPPPLVNIKKDPKLANNWKAKPAEELTDAEVLAMPDSEYMNDKQMAFFRSKLVQLKQDILNNAGETTEHLREDTVIVPDPADRATIEEEHALELRTRDRERKLLKKIEQSIARIDAGDYGYCDETGEPIGVGRLLARPTATLSLEAQQRRELKQKMFGD
ncbi:MULTISPECIES: RNA polymerase-binding protein DksA [Ramlibacter]|uniref:RNA polymerase-binding transcription factor DksA n=1 Tax=Ramlibacter pinisoli TaxID=2682844 RepID=A0A6N8IRJ4_9BURK|nr:RNA polymerase-binding protein DksA [Ramlibacter sp. CGMCC 1.13660]MVQ29529.1 RNA polymerase-binding protein DksA [Ramlibacter pinisoli]